jgi:hypothetical protein
MFPRVANCCGFGVGGPPAAHQLKRVRLAVQTETANNAIANKHRPVEVRVLISLEVVFAVIRWTRGLDVATSLALVQN